jgi:hypothetical protein
MTDPRTPTRQMRTAPWSARVYSHDQGDFRNVRDSNVLVYWPHGFGDWVQLASVISLLDDSNRYWITRFGDDNTSVFDGHPHVTPLYLGYSSTHCRDGDAFANRHFGIRYEDITGDELELQLPTTLHACCERNDIRTVLWSAYPETHGYVPYPFHTKPRNLIRNLAGGGRVERALTGPPLGNSIRFDSPGWIVDWVESRLRNFADDGSKLCVIGRNGYTAVGKNWGHRWREDLPPSRAYEGEECRDFMRLMLRRDPSWVFLVVEDQLYSGHDTVRSRDLRAVSYAELFGTPGPSSIPFGLIMKAILSLADLCVGVPAGPYHLALARADLPVVGLWLEHLPSWYDEPRPGSIHVVSRNVRDQGLDQRPGSFVSCGPLDFQMLAVDTRIITGEQALHAVEQLLA